MLKSEYSLPMASEAIVISVFDSTRAEAYGIIRHRLWYLYLLSDHLIS